VGLRLLEQSSSLELSTAWLLPFTRLYPIDTTSISTGALPAPQTLLLVGMMNPGLSLNGWLGI
jgi:hypothetical protein